MHQAKSARRRRSFGCREYSHTSQDPAAACLPNPLPPCPVRPPGGGPTWAAQPSTSTWPYTPASITHFPSPFVAPVTTAVLLVRSQSSSCPSGLAIASHCPRDWPRQFQSVKAVQLVFASTTFTDRVPASASWQPSTSIRHGLRLCRASRSPTNQSGASQDGLQHCLHGAAGGAWPAGAMQGVDQRQAAQRHCRAAVPAPAGRNAAVRGDRRCLPGQSDAGLQGGQEGHHQPGGGQGPVSAARRGLRAGLRHNFMALPTLSPARLLRCAWAARGVPWPVYLRGAEPGGCGGRWEEPADGAGGSCSMRAAAPAWGVRKLPGPSVHGC